MRKSRRKRGGDGTGQTAEGEGCEGQRRAPSSKEGAKGARHRFLRFVSCTCRDLRRSILPQAVFAVPLYARLRRASRRCPRYRVSSHIGSFRFCGAAPPGTDIFVAHPSRRASLRIGPAQFPRAVSPAQSLPRNLSRAVSRRTFAIPLLHPSRIPQQDTAPPLNSAPPRLLHRTPSADGIKHSGRFPECQKNIVVIFKDLLYNNIW